MASPPQDLPNNSPPYPSNINLPQASHKRRPSEAPSSKRRKASMISVNSTTSAHPLRQTSFPPESAVFTPNYERSPSVDTMSLVSGSVAGPGRKKRARKSKTGKGIDEESATGSNKQDGPLAKKRRTSNASADEEEDDGVDQTITHMASGTKEEKQREMEKRAVLVKHMDDQQFRRYEAVRSAKLADATVRRIVNQTLSQSVPATVILAIRSVAKQYIGEVIEGARKVQTQWIEAGEPNSGLPSPPAEDTTMEGGDDVKEARELRRAPLQADHLREALRRSRDATEGGMAGQLNLWQLQQHNGVERFATRVRGKRLFK
ncbi:transcription initiation factor TFIID subunit 11 protein [Rutstroemia sp. NJR-2017a BVV2]|nr:transcription initiation factor TFIID subunit 11 protein [Rutstroemia sp. NJR-2017a BVV2]